MSLTQMDLNTSITLGSNKITSKGNQKDGHKSPIIFFVLLHTLEREGISEL